MEEQNLIYEKMGANYQYLLDIMGAIHSGRELTSEELLNELGRVANEMLNIQREHVQLNIEQNVQEILFNQIDAKQDTLNSALSNGRGSR